MQESEIILVSLCQLKPLQHGPLPAALAEGQLQFDSIPKRNFFFSAHLQATKCSALLPQSHSENPLPNKVTSNAEFNTSYFSWIIKYIFEQKCIFYASNVSCGPTSTQNSTIFFVDFCIFSYTLDLEFQSYCREKVIIVF